MDNHNQVIKLCGVCGNKQVYSENHRIYNPCKAVKHVLLKIQLQTIKLKEGKKLQDLNYIENTKYVRKSHTQLIEEPNNKVDEITHTFEKLFLKNCIDLNYKVNCTP